MTMFQVHQQERAPATPVIEAYSCSRTVPTVPAENITHRAAPAGTIHGLRPPS